METWCHCLVNIGAGVYKVTFLVVPLTLQDSRLLVCPPSVITGRLRVREIAYSLEGFFDYTYIKM